MTRRVLGIDPGSRVSGYGLVEESEGKFKLRQVGVLRLGKYVDEQLKWRKLYEGICGVVGEFKPEEVALESPFYGQNVQSMLKLGRAQGLAIAASLHHSVPFFEYAPKKIKKSLTGNGMASKEQVAAMLSQLVALPPKLPLDATDAVAVALCHCFNHRDGLGRGR